MTWGSEPVGKPALTDKERRDRLIRRAAIAGAVGALLCHTLPPEHRGACTAAVKVLSMSCGGN